MKQITQKLLAFAFVATVLASCGGDDEEPKPEAPTLNVSGTVANGGSIQLGDSVVMTVNATTPGGYNVVRASGSLSAEWTRDDLGLDAGATTASFEFSVKPEGLGLIEVDFELVDDENQTDTASYSFEVVSPDVNTYQAVLLGAQGNAEKGFYNALENIKYSYAEARDASTVEASPVDFAYYWGNTNNSTLASIDDASLNAVYDAVGLPIDGIFGTKNSTTFVKTEWTDADFDGVTNNAALEQAAIFETGGETSVTGLTATDEVIAFRFDDDRGGAFGLIKVVSIDDTNGTGTMTIEVKVPGE